MKVLLIDPPGWQKGVLNSGLAYLSAALLDAGFETKAIDANNFPISDNELVKLAWDYGPGVIGFSVKSATVSSSARLSRRLKNECSGTVLIAGGPHITLYHREFLNENNHFDLLFSGDAEISLPRSLKGLKSRKKDAPKSQRQESLDDLDSLKFPSYDFFYPEPTDALLKEKYPLVTSRGCPFKCTFCTVPPLSGAGWRGRAPENVIGELKYAKDKYGIKKFEIIDDNFAFKIERAKAISSLLIREDIDLRWSCPNGIRAAPLDEELAGLMKEAGCEEVSIGIESADEEVFRALKKGVTLDDIERSIGILKKAGMKVKGFFIIGLPGDNLQKLGKSLEFIKRTGLDGAEFGLFVPYPGTEAYEWARENGRALRDYKEGVHFGADSIRPVFETDEFTESQRVQALEKACATVEDFGSRVMPRNLSPFARKKRILYLMWKHNRGKFPGYLRRLGA